MDSPRELGPWASTRRGSVADSAGELLSRRGSTAACDVGEWSFKEGAETSRSLLHENDSAACSGAYAGAGIREGSGGYGLMAMPYMRRAGARERAIRHWQLALHAWKRKSGRIASFHMPSVMELVKDRERQAKEAAAAAAYAARGGPLDAARAEVRSVLANGGRLLPPMERRASTGTLRPAEIVRIQDMRSVLRGMHCNGQSVGHAGAVREDHMKAVAAFMADTEAAAKASARAERQAEEAAGAAERQRGLLRAVSEIVVSLSKVEHAAQPPAAPPCRPRAVSFSGAPPGASLTPTPPTVPSSSPAAPRAAPRGFKSVAGSAMRAVLLMRPRPSDTAMAGTIEGLASAESFVNRRLLSQNRPSLPLMGVVNVAGPAAALGGNPGGAEPTPGASLLSSHSSNHLSAHAHPAVSMMSRNHSLPMEQHRITR